MGRLNTGEVATFDVIVNAESEHHVRVLDHGLNQRWFFRVSADTSLTKTS